MILEVKSKWKDASGRSHRNKWHQICLTSGPVYEMFQNRYRKSVRLETCDGTVTEFRRKVEDQRQHTEQDDWETMNGRIS